MHRYRPVPEQKLPVAKNMRPGATCQRRHRRATAGSALSQGTRGPAGRFCSVSGTDRRRPGNDLCATGASAGTTQPKGEFLAPELEQAVMSEPLYPTQFGRTLVGALLGAVATDSHNKLPTLCHRVPVALPGSDRPAFYTVHLSPDQKGAFLASCAAFPDILMFG